MLAVGVRHYGCLLAALVVACLVRLLAVHRGLPLTAQAAAWTPADHYDREGTGNSSRRTTLLLNASLDAATAKAAWWRALSRPLCTVLAIGDDVVLRGAPLAIADAFPNCIVRAGAHRLQARRWVDSIALLQLGDAPSNLQHFDPPPANMVLHPVRLVSDFFDVLGPGALQDEVLNVRMTTFLQNTPAERFAAVVVRARATEDIAALQELLNYTAAATVGDGDLIVVVQHCDGDEVDASLGVLLEGHGMAFLGPLSQERDGRRHVLSHWCAAGPLHEEVFGRSASSPRPRARAPAAGPLLGFLPWGRFTNNILELSALVGVARLLNRTVVVPDLSAADCSLYINHAQLADALGGPDQVVCADQAATLRADWPRDGLFVELASPDKATSSPTTLTATVRQATASIPSDRPLILPGWFLFYGHFWGEGRDPEYWPRAWLEFSPTVHELANRVHTSFARTLGSQPGTKPALLGVHVRLSDYGDRSTGDLWADALHMAASLAPRSIEGVVLCTDSPNHPIVRKLRNLWAHVPFLGCLEGALPPVAQQRLRAVNAAVIQTVLEQVDCFVGLYDSSFSWRIQARRVLEGRAALCDQTVRAM